jgi:hypothetical protein
LKEYDIKRGHFKNIDGEKLKELLEETFGEVKLEDDKFMIKYGALQPLIAWIKSKNILCVDTHMETKISEEEINETIKRFNRFLESATGFTAKERVKRAKKKVE